MEESVSKIEVFFMGCGKVYKDGVPLDFPYLKARLLFFVLAETHAADRDELCRLLWNESPWTARQNLRNALSSLRRLLPEDFLIADRKSVRLAHPLDGDPAAFSFRVDLEEMDENTLDPSNIRRLSLPFLDGAETAEAGKADKKGERLREWIQGRRAYYHKKLYNAVRRKMESAPLEERPFWHEHSLALEKSSPGSFVKTTPTVGDNGKDARGDLTEDESDLLDCAAVFPEAAPFDALKHLAKLDDGTLVRLYEKLHRKELLLASGHGTFDIVFRSAQVQEQIRGAMSEMKWWSLNRRLLTYLKGDEISLRDKAALGTKALISTARSAGDFEAELSARILELKNRFEFNHELFPMLADGEFPGSSTDDILPVQDLKEAQELLDKSVRMWGRTPRFVDCERMLLTLRGGYLRWSGNYVDATNCLEEALKLVLRSSSRKDALLEVLEQFCYLGIQNDSANLLKRYVFSFYREAMKAQLHPQIGMALRFLGIFNMMEGRYDGAKKLLDMSIRLFEKLEACGNGYTLSVVAAVHYHGDIALYRGDYKNAGTHYRQCAQLCESKGFLRGLGLLLAKEAWCALQQGNLSVVRENLSRARPLFEGFRSRRGAGMCAGEIVFGLSALLDLQDGAPRRALENLRHSEELATIIRKPLWNAIHFCIKANLKSTLEAMPKEGRQRYSLLEEALVRETGYYLERARELFESLGLPGKRGNVSLEKFSMSQ
jgi:tetratricopeptide (TPR) repeat protein